MRKPLSYHPQILPQGSANRSDYGASASIAAAIVNRCRSFLPTPGEVEEQWRKVENGGTNAVYLRSVHGVSGGTVLDKTVALKKKIAYGFFHADEQFYV